MNNPVSKYNLDVLIAGENIDLCAATEEFARTSTWYKWFNDPVTTRFLEQGIVPNTAEGQVEFYRQLLKSQDRISFIISDKEQYIGTISLSFLNYYKRTADIALVVGEKSQSKNADLLALEAMARVTEFAFERVGLKRVSAGQHEKLLKWQCRLEILGYRLEGYKAKGFLKGPEESNSVIIGVTADDYQVIKKHRTKLWDSSDKIRERIKAMPSVPFVESFKKFLSNEGEQYYQTVFSL